MGLQTNKRNSGDLPLASKVDSDGSDLLGIHGRDIYI